jgi:hypothetical protein
MIIVNKEARLHHIGDLLSLMPGTNEVDPAVWAKCKEIAVTRHHVEAGTLVERAESSLKDFKPEQAIKLVNETVDVALLERWLGTVTNRRVTDAIHARRALLIDAGEKAAAERSKE